MLFSKMRVAPTGLSRFNIPLSTESLSLQHPGTNRNVFLAQTASHSSLTVHLVAQLQCDDLSNCLCFSAFSTHSALELLKAVACFSQKTLSYELHNADLAARRIRAKVLMEGTRDYASTFLKHPVVHF